MPSILTYLLLQAPAEVASADVVQEVEVNVLQLLMEGGWYIMIPLALMSLIGMYVFFERFLAIRKADKVSPDFMQKLKDYICLLYTSPSPRDRTRSRMPSSA